MSIELAAPYNVPTTVTLLPNPQFGDEEGVDAQVIYHEAGDGTPYTYIRKSGKRRLVWTWTSVAIPKALEVQAFVKQYFASTIRIRDFRGNVWRGFLEATPTFSRDQRDVVSFTLTFLVERISSA